jgi:hypothetical protein
MLSSLFFLLATKIFFLRALALLLGREARRKGKSELLSLLVKLKKLSFSDLAQKSLSLTNDALNYIGDRRIFSLKYVLRLSAFGAIVGLCFSAFTLLVVAGDPKKVVSAFNIEGWRNFFFIPAIVTSAIFTPIDLICTHLLIRWTLRNPRVRIPVYLVVALPMVVILWNVSAGFLVWFSFFRTIGFADFSFLLNRIVESFLNPFDGAAKLSLGTRWVSFGMLAASVSFTSLLALFLSLLALSVKNLSSRSLSLIATLVFRLLKVLDWFESKQLNIPVTLIVCGVVVVFLLIALGFRMVGL